MWGYPLKKKIEDIHDGFILGRVDGEEKRCGNRFSGIVFPELQQFEDMLIDVRKIAELDSLNNNL